MNAPSQQPDERIAHSSTRPKTRWFHLSILVMVVLFVIVIRYRDSLRAEWWTYRLMNTEDLQERSTYLNLLISAGPSASDAVEKLAGSPDPDLRLMSVFIRRSWDDIFSLVYLSRMLDDPDDEVRKSAALALAFSTNAWPIGFLVHASESGDVRLAATAVAALGRMNTPEAIEAICQALIHHPSARVRAQAVESLTDWLAGDQRPRAHKQRASIKPDCDPFAALVYALGDQQTFTGLLELEQEIVEVSAFARRSGLATSESAADATTQATERSVAQTAAKCLSALTGRTIIPAKFESTGEQAKYADQCRRWYRRHVRHVLPNNQNPQSQPSDSSDTFNGSKSD